MFLGPRGFIIFFGSDLPPASPSSSSGFSTTFSTTFSSTGASASILEETQKKFKFCIKKINEILKNRNK